MPLSKYKNLGDLLSVGIMFPACIGIGYGIGHFLDQWTGSKSAFKTICLFLGIAAAFINLFKVIRKLEREGE
ncbi:MAG: AtpZ/AtpI family protein [Acidobacteria bacterium]|nr:AtpZ/AtpI family protein [Acidobacteriota bacterium]MCI0719150.1 AtpZ/AtpI family protein [Acidobacteriota bacterium]